jgi:hypothetical protein
VLSWHVDYWDYIGWKDPFGSREYSDRQSRYAKALKLKNRWTPMLMVDNRPIRSAQFQATVAKARATGTPFDATLIAALKDGRIEGTVTIRLLDPEWEASDDIVVQPVLFQRRAKTDCKTGENKGKVLEEYFVVRAAPGALDRGKAFGKGARVSLSAPQGVAADNLGLAILVEDRRKMRTLDCWWVPVAAPSRPPRADGE